MKRVIALILVAAAVAAVIGSAPASAGTSTDRRVAALEAQIRTLRAQVKTLRADVAVIRRTVDTSQDEFRKEAARNRVGDACLALSVADVMQSTWTNLDGRVTGSGFGPQQQLDDVSCKAIGVARPGIASHPTVNVFWALTGWLIG